MFSLKYSVYIVEILKRENYITNLIGIDINYVQNVLEEETIIILLDIKNIKTELNLEI